MYNNNNNKNTLYTVAQGLLVTNNYWATYILKTNILSCLKVLLL